MTDKEIFVTVREVILCPFHKMYPDKTSPRCKCQYIFKRIRKEELNKDNRE